MDLSNKETNTKFQVFEYAKNSGNVSLTSRYFSIMRQVFL